MLRYVPPTPVSDSSGRWAWGKEMLREKSLKNQRHRVNSILLHSKVQKKFIYFYVFGCFVCIYIFITQVPDVLRGQASDPLGPELQMVAGHHVGARN